MENSAIRRNPRSDTIAERNFGRHVFSLISMYSPTINFPQVTVSASCQENDVSTGVVCFQYLGIDWEGAEELDFLRDLCYIILL